MNNEILIYQNQDGNFKIDVCLENEMVWLTQDQMQELFQKSKATISEHFYSKVLAFLATPQFFVLPLDSLKTSQTTPNSTPRKRKPRKH